MSGLKFRKGGSTKKKGGYAGPPEPCGIEVAHNSVVTLAIPYQTKRAGEIRTAVNTKVLTQEDKRIFFFRSENEEWTNVALQSTDTNPLLTADPVYSVEKAYAVLKACPAVSTVTIVDEDENPLTLAEVKAMEFAPYEGSPEAAEEEEDEVAEAVLELKDVTAKHDTQMHEIAAKLGRAESEVQALKDEIAELRAAVAAAAAGAAIKYRS